MFLSPLPAWSSYEFAGMPAFADPQAAAFYPLHLFFSRIVGSWTAFIVSAYVLAACFMYAYVYFHTRSALAATLSGLVYALSEALIERMPHPTVVHVLAWLPLILLSLDAIQQQHRRWRWMAIGAVAAANCLLAGHPQMQVYVAAVCALYAVAGAIASRAGMSSLAAVASMVVAAAALAGVMLVPLVETSRYLERQAVDFQEFVDYANTWPQMLSALFPSVAHAGNEAPTYSGLSTLMLAPLGALALRTNWRVAFWLATAAIALCLGVGAGTPLAQVVYEIPLYDKFRIGARHLVFVAAAAAILAGFGLAAIEQGRFRFRSVALAGLGLLVALIAGALVIACRPDMFQFERLDEPSLLPVLNLGVWRQLAIGAALATACVALYWRRAFRAVAVILIVFSAGDLVLSSSYPVSARGLTLHTVTGQALLPSVHARRIAAALAPRQQRLLAPTSGHDNDVVPAGFATVWRIPIAGGYNPMLLQGIAALAMMQLNGAVNDRVLAANDAALDLLAVRYILLKREAITGERSVLLSAPDRWREVERFSTSRLSDRGTDEATGDETEYVLLENRRAMPRAWLAREVIPLSDGALLDTIRHSRLPDGRPLDAARMALVYEGGPGPRAYPAGDTAVSVEPIGAGSIRVRVRSPGGFLVLSEANYPGWSARIGDRPLPIYTTAAALQGVEVPPGEHLIEFAFTARSRQAGAIASAIGMLLVAGMAIAAWRVRTPVE